MKGAAPAERAPSRQDEGRAPLAAVASGDALTRYRLGVASHLERQALLQAGRALTGFVVVEMDILVTSGRAVAVEVQQDGGAPAFAAEVRRAVWNALASVPLPPEWVGQSLRVGLALGFEPAAPD